MTEALLESGSVLQSRDLGRIFSAKQIFKPSTKGFFTFLDGQLSYYGSPGTEASLYVDKASFPEGLSLMTLELLNFSKNALDWSFELIVERIDGSVSRLSPFDLVQVKRGVCSFCHEIFSNITELRFNNLGAVNPTTFSIGLLVLRS